LVPFLFTHVRLIVGRIIMICIGLKMFLSKQILIKIYLINKRKKETSFCFQMIEQLILTFIVLVILALIVLSVSCLVEFG